MVTGAVPCWTDTRRLKTCAKKSDNGLHGLNCTIQPPPQKHCVLVNSRLKWPFTRRKCTSVPRDNQKRRKFWLHCSFKSCTSSFQATEFHKQGSSESKRPGNNWPSAKALTKTRETRQTPRLPGVYLSRLLSLGTSKRTCVPKMAINQAYLQHNVGRFSCCHVPWQRTVVKNHQHSCITSNVLVSELRTTFSND